MKISNNTPLPGLCGQFTQGELTEKEPFVFTSGHFMQYLTKPEWEQLKGYAKQQKADGDKAPKQPLGELETLEAKYAALESKNSKEGVALRERIKQLKADGDK